MSRSPEMEDVLQGRDPVANAVIAFLIERGWHGDRIIKNVAMKVYKPNQATFRVTLDREYRQYWVHGEYYSEGGNVLCCCFACIPADASPDVLDASMETLLCDAEKAINASFAVRFLGSPS